MSICTYISRYTLFSGGDKCKMPLSGVKVIELAGHVPGPFCGMLLADFGATVIKVDRINSHLKLDCLRHGKQSIALNLKHPKGALILRSLCQDADVLIDPFKSGTMESLNLGPEQLLKENPRLIYARLNGYGGKGPYKEKPGHDLNFLAMSGIMQMLGQSNGKPTFPANIGAGLGGGGLLFAFGIVMALFERTKSGIGQVVENNMVGGTAYLGSWLFRSQNLPIWGKPRGQNMLDGGVHYYNVYETKDEKFLSVAPIEPHFYLNLLKALGIDENDAPHYENYEENKMLFAAKFKEKTRDEWEKIFCDIDVCVTPVLSPVEALNHAQNKESKTFIKTDEVIVPNPLPKFSRTPGVSVATKEKPSCGEHTFRILTELGLNEKEIQELETNNVIGCYRNQDS